MEVVIFAVTGDVAHSGLREEYDVASTFLETLKDGVSKIDSSLPVHFVFVPGNHDCNFRAEGDARPALLESLAAKIETLDPFGDIVREITNVQDEFFSFEGRFQADGIPKSDRLRYQTRIRLGDLEIVFDCYNTSWASRKDEKPGTLLFPPRLLTPEAASHDAPGQLKISLLHHRDNWLEPSNARVLRDHLDAYSDVILTGHEHVSASYTKSRQNGARAYYLEGAVLQDSKNPGDSGFHVLEFDIDAEKQKTVRYRWSGQLYHRDEDSGWSKFERNGALARARFRIAPAFLKILRDPGTGFVHPAKPDLSLDDLFIYPDLRRKSFRKLVKSSSAAVVVSGKDILQFVTSSKRTMISGPDDSGKTSLANTLYLDLRQQGLLPVLLNGADIRGGNLDAVFQRELQKAIATQYSNDAVEPIEQVDPARKVLIVDDWHRLKYSSKGQIALLKLAEKAFDHVICFADDVFALELLTGGDEKPFRDYELCEIKEFGHLLRNELIRKWLVLGAEYSESDEKLARSVTVVESTVNTLIGKNLLPAFPVIIVAILQSHAANRAPNSTAGSYGQMYEALITAALASVSKKAVDLGTKYTYISHIAQHVLETGQTRAVSQ